MVTFSFKRKIPCPPDVSFHPRSSVRDDSFKAIIDVIVFETEWVICLKNHVFEKNSILDFEVKNMMVVLAIIAPRIVTRRGVIFIMFFGNRGGVFSIHSERNHPMIIVPVANRIRGL